MPERCVSSHKLKQVLKRIVPPWALALYRKRKSSHMFQWLTLVSRTSSQERIRILIEQANGNPLWLPAIDLLTPFRFDIAAKTLYGRHRLKKVKCTWATDIYAEHLRVWNGFHEIAPVKKGLQEFLDAFDTILISIHEEGFDSSQSIIPIGKTASPINGAHRIAASILCGKKVFCQPYPAELSSHNYSYYYFRDRNVHGRMSTATSDAIALEYCLQKKETFAALVFPSAQGKHEQVQNTLSEFGNPVYEKALLLSEAAAFNLMRIIYQDEAWLGNASNGFPGAREKTKLCFNRPGPLRLFLIEAASGEQMAKAKQAIRTIFKIGKHSIHINDRHPDTLRIMQTLCNPNGLHLLKTRGENTYTILEQSIKDLKTWVMKHNVDLEDLCVSGSGSLSAYGLRKCADLDILHASNINVGSLPKGIGSHEDYAHHYPKSVDEIVYNPSNHFYYRGIKFVSLPLVRNMKNSRGEQKDIQDVKLIDSLQEKHAENYQESNSRVSSF